MFDLPRRFDAGPGAENAAEGDQCQAGRLAGACGQACSQRRGGRRGGGGEQAPAVPGEHRGSDGTRLGVGLGSPRRGGGLDRGRGRVVVEAGELDPGGVPGRPVGEAHPRGRDGAGVHEGPPVVLGECERLGAHGFAFGGERVQPRVVRERDGPFAARGGRPQEAGLLGPVEAPVADQEQVDVLGGAGADADGVGREESPRPVLCVDEGVSGPVLDGLVPLAEGRFVGVPVGAEPALADLASGQ
ncbi:hypothetical protein [Glycomyces paridis]|uniref:Uncharacterized protein n=1 Tax=Glycomyces paridis TaxID=2126555 RepID=A0A4S8PCJ2_9ACTN|nr:hypothetical protein [Glycomyces paridis]THV28030.1 hypothetical protein E9998_13710 [Glycomyces paridis]